MYLREYGIDPDQSTFAGENKKLWMLCIGRAEKPVSNIEKTWQTVRPAAKHFAAITAAVNRFFTPVLLENRDRMTEHSKNKLDFDDAAEK